MRKSRFTEAQIIGMIKEQGSSVKRLIQWINRSAEWDADCGSMLQARPERRNVLQADVQVWRTGSVRSYPAEGPRG